MLRGQHDAANAGGYLPVYNLYLFEGIAFTQFTRADVVRHPLVGRIVEAYDNRAAATGGRA